MLPTTPAPEEHAPILVAFYQVGAQVVDKSLLTSLGLSNAVLSDNSNRIYADLDGSTTAVFLTDENADSSILEACDGVVFVLNAASGVSAEAIAHWSNLADFEIPRHVLATNLFATHTDFDELVAISRRVFSEEILVRYLPMADDAETRVVALYDLLQNSILDFSEGTSVLTSPDIEHIELTADQREKLFESLAYLGLADEAFEMYQAGITPPIKTFETAWAADTTISISPKDGIVGHAVLIEWISNLSNRWNPTVESDEYQTHTSSPHFYGYGIAQGLARTWGRTESVVEVTNSNGDCEDISDGTFLASCVLANNIQTGDTIREHGDSVLLDAPIFD